MKCNTLIPATIEITEQIPKIHVDALKMNRKDSNPIIPTGFRTSQKIIVVAKTIENMIPISPIVMIHIRSRSTPAISCLTLEIVPSRSSLIAASSNNQNNTSTAWYLEG